MEIKTSKDYHQTEKGKKEEATHTHIEDIQRLVTEVSSTTYKKQRNYLSLTKHWRKQVSLYRLF
jgi:hypothetical protein